MNTEKIFAALASPVRRKVLAYLSAASLTAGEIADRFEISKPSLSKHLSVLENAGLIKGEKKGQYIHYSLVEENLTNTLNGYVQEVCPFARPIRKESRDLAASRKSDQD
ncbi:MAG: metalloregulator ArsR/SmtB family transcription factor [Pseudomonadota bacterium]